VARWRSNLEQEPPDELVDFDPDDWVLGARNKPERIRMALDRWHAARLEWVMQDSGRRTIDGLDAVDLIFYDAS
jgi:hypothetical protein